MARFNCKVGGLTSRVSDPKEMKDDNTHLLLRLGRAALGLVMDGHVLHGGGILERGERVGERREGDDVCCHGAI